MHSLYRAKKVIEDSFRFKTLNSILPVPSYEFELQNSETGIGNRFKIQNFSLYISVVHINECFCCVVPNGEH